MEVRAEGSRRGFSKLGNDMKRTRPQFLPFYEARGMLPCTTEPRATAMAASRAQSHLALQRSPTIHPSYHMYTRLRNHEHSARPHQPLPQSRAITSEGYRAAAECAVEERAAAKSTAAEHTATARAAVEHAAIDRTAATRTAVSRAAVGRPAVERTAAKRTAAKRTAAARAAVGRAAIDGPP